MIKNNLEHQREQCVRNDAPPSGQERQSFAAVSGNVSFVYAVQADGKLMGETLWEKQRQEAGNNYNYTFREDSIDQQRQSGISLANIEKMMTDSLLQYQQQAAIPREPPPEVVSNNNNDNINNNNDVTKFHDSSDKSLYMEGRKEQSNQNNLNKSNKTTTLSTASTAAVNNTHGDGDEYDSLLADFDVDQVISQHKHQSGNRRAMSCYNQQKSGGDDDSSSFLSTSRTDFDYGNIGEEEPPTSNHGGVSSFNGNAAFGNAGSSSGNSFSNSENHGSSTVNNFNSNNTFNYDDPMPSYNNNDQHEGDVPLCPEHGIPCRLRTSTTSTNPGRQFYRCSLPDGRDCGFVQWADGMEGNWNNGFDTSICGSAAGGGDTRDMHEGNRRIFGHRSFRPGQKDVIEKAIQGRDVFVLMPTG
jgi:hypothetical protein